MMLADSASAINSAVGVADDDINEAFVVSTTIKYVYIIVFFLVTAVV